MAEQVYKMLMFLKRRPGMTVQAFRDHYENTHRKIGEKYSVGAIRFVRRYLEPVADPVTGEPVELAFDVVGEVWFKDPGIVEMILKATAEGTLPDDVIADEEKLFDRAKSQFATVVEFESDPADFGVDNTGSTPAAM